MKEPLDNYYDLLIVLGRISILVEKFYYNFTEHQMEKINMYCDTVLFHVNERSERPIILAELESMLKYIDDQLTEMKM